MEPESLLQRYRQDRRKLLELLLTSGLIKEIRTTSGSTNLSDAEFDTLSVDYILHCVKSDGIVDVSEAKKCYHAESTLPIMIHSKLGDSYFLTSDPNLAGSPPRRVPPPIISRNISHASPSSSQLDSFKVDNVETCWDDYNLKHIIETAVDRTPLGNSGIPSLGLPALKTGLSDDDLRESAYELLLASMLFSGVEISPLEDRKKEKSSKFLSRLKSKREKPQVQAQLSERHSELIDTIRAQMQVSEAMDACIRRNMVQLAARRTSDQIDLPQISLGLLIGIFRSDFLSEKSYLQWKSRQVNILEELLYFSAKLPEADRLIIQSCLAKIRDTKEWDVAMSPSQQVEVISSIRQVASKVSSQQGQFGIQNETYYWHAVYHLNIRLYEKLLYVMFDILDEGQLIEEADAIQSLIKQAWPTLGITEKIHNALYGWVLVQQFIGTDESTLLEHAILQLRKVVSADEEDWNEKQYMNNIICLKQCNGSQTKLNLVQAIFLSIGTWIDIKLQDYHLHFSEKPVNFRRVMALASATGMLTPIGCADTKLTMNGFKSTSGGEIKNYVERSVEAAIRRVANTVLHSKVEKMHPLALLANQLRLVAEREINIFVPVFHQWFPESIMISVQLLHKFYGERLIPFLEGVSSLSEDAKSVLPAAYMLDKKLGQLYTSAIEEQITQQSLSSYLDHYQIEKVSGPIILDWLIGQHDHILEWTGRALDFEEWEPLSFHQRQAASIIEVFRILEETVDQLFGLNLPLDITHLQALLSIVFHSLDGYLQGLQNQLVEKNHLYPSAPPLTRYTETVIQMTKKRLNEYTVLDDNMVARLNELIISKLCIRLNTLQYIQKQVSLLEDGIRKCWAQVSPSLNLRRAKEDTSEITESDLSTHNEAVDELFVTTFNIINDTAKDIGQKICNLIGTRVVFWDLRETFLFHLYRGSVQIARLENFIADFDMELDNICGLIDDAVRDLVVLSVCQASMEGFVWVLLDGGPSRAYSDSDVNLMEEDLITLKEFFIADGEGLPRSVVEQEAKFAERVLHMFSLQTETVIQMLMTASELISMGLDSNKHGQMHLGDAHTLVRVLCHKKDREASRFLKVQYQLPMSSDYDDSPSRDSTLRSPLISDVLKRSTSIHWTKKGQSGFKSMKKKLQEATNEIRNVTR